MSKSFLNSCTIEDLQELVKSRNLPVFRAKQIHDWIYRKYTLELEDMSNLPKNVRSSLETDFSVTSLKVIERAEDSEGTCKLLLAL